jgi:anti-sigma regulatory factor (Ser/Thr protein kinase)
MTAAVAARPKVRVFPGSPDQVHHARDFVARALAGFPAVDDAVLLASEVVTNAVVHTASGDGGAFAVMVCRDGNRARIAVRDGGADKVPVTRPVNRGGESGLGLGLVDVLADRWGHDGDARGRVVWFEVSAT